MDLKQNINRLVNQYLNNIDTYKNNEQYNEQACRDEFTSSHFQSKDRTISEIDEQFLTASRPVRNVLRSTGFQKMKLQVKMRNIYAKYDLFYIQAWLNNPYTEKIISIMGSDFEGGFIARGTYLLKKLPFIDLDFSSPSQKELYDSVVSFVKASERNLPSA